MTRLIQLYPRYLYHIAFVDDDDYKLVCQFAWQLHTSERRSTMYARRRDHMTMHRLLYPAPSGLVTAHKNGNGLDNRRSNLFHTTQNENLQVRKIRNDSSNGTGIKFDKRSGHWGATITTYGKDIWLGTFLSREEAIAARKAAEIKHKPQWREDYDNS